MFLDSIKDNKLQLVVITITAIGNFFFDSPKPGRLLDAIFQVKNKHFYLCHWQISVIYKLSYFSLITGVYIVLKKSFQPHPPLKIFFLHLLGKFYVYSCLFVELGKINNFRGNINFG